MDHNQFYVVLPSDSSIDVYPDNTTACFTAKLPKEINLHGKWVVGLSEISFPTTFINIEEAHTFRVVIKEGNFLLYDKVVELPLKQYKDIHEVLKYINIQTEHSLELFKFTIDENDNSIDIEICSSCPGINRNTTFIFTFTPELARILGYRPVGGKINDTEVSLEINRISAEQKKKLFQFPVNLDINLPKQLYVYTDICEPYIVGDIQARLLRTLPIRYKDYVFDRLQWVTFPSVIYIPLLSNTFRTVSIDIRTHLGKPAPFAYGTSCVTLHFKRVD